MISMSDKLETQRRATAQAIVHMSAAAYVRLKANDLPKPGVLETARAAGLLAAKRTPDLIPHCHPLALDEVSLDFEWVDGESGGGVQVRATVSTIAKTGVEMEALTAASVAALVIYDMLKGIDKNLSISAVRLLEKTGGKSDFKAKLAPSLSITVLMTHLAPGKSGDFEALIRQNLLPYGAERLTFESVDDHPQALHRRLQSLVEEQTGLIFTVGGSGLDEHDRTVDIVGELVEREIPGVMEAARAYGQRRTPYAMLSRGVAGQCGKSVLVTLPGSRRGLQETLTAILPGLVHGVAVMHKKTA